MYTRIGLCRKKRSVNIFDQIDVFTACRDMNEVAAATRVS